MNTETKTANTTRKTKPFIIAGVTLITAIWVAVFAALAILQPDLRTKALIVAGGAGATELILYAGAAWFGINLFQRFRSFIRMRRD